MVLGRRRERALPTVFRKHSIQLHFSTTRLHSLMRLLAYISLTQGYGCASLVDAVIRLQIVTLACRIQLKIALLPTLININQSEIITWHAGLVCSSAAFIHFWLIANAPTRRSLQWLHNQGNSDTLWILDENESEFRHCYSSRQAILRPGARYAGIDDGFVAVGRWRDYGLLQYIWTRRLRLLYA